MPRRRIKNKFKSVFLKPKRKVEAAALIVLFLIFVVIVILPMFEKPADKEPLEPELPARETAPFPLKIYDHRQGEIVEMDLEEYLIGVVAAEMPASFHIEALRAQAVVARTYTIQKIQTQRGGDKHPEADICTDHTHCQAWISTETALGNWDEKGSEYIKKITAAVKSTAGLVATHNEEIIDAVYHSTCGGQTSAAEHVWSGTAPYLVSRDCDYCSHSPWFRKEEEISFDTFRQAFSESGALPVMTGDGIPRIEIIEASTIGRAKSIKVGEKVYNALEFRQKLDLPTTWFDYYYQGNKIYFDLRGYGHGVGFCQYGADGMGKEGKSYEEIILYYYNDIEITDLTP